MKKDQSDQELSFKKRARRRLVGAIALVLLMIISLPMVLEDRAVVQQEVIAITMENEVNEFDTSGFDSSIVPEEGLDAELTAILEDAAVEIELPEQAEFVLEAEAPAKPKEAAKLSEQKIAVKAASKAAIGATDQHYVQVGVYSDAANVEKLQVKLKDLGYQSKTEKVSTEKGEKIRLRTTVFSDKNEAVIALENIKDSGLTGMVVKQK